MPSPRPDPDMLRVWVGFESTNGEAAGVEVSKLRDILGSCTRWRVQVYAQTGTQSSENIADICKRVSRSAFRWPVGAAEFNFLSVTLRDVVLAMDAVSVCSQQCPYATEIVWVLLC